MIQDTYIPHMGASFALKEDILRIGMTFELPSGEITGGSVMISDGCRVTVNPDNLHTLVEGSTDSGKSRRFNMPTLYTHAGPSRC